MITALKYLPQVELDVMMTALKYLPQGEWDKPDDDSFEEPTTR